MAIIAAVRRKIHLSPCSDFRGQLYTGKAKPRRKHAKYLATRSGRIRLAMIADNSAASIEAFVNANVKRGATLLTDGHKSFPGLRGYRHVRGDN